MKLSDTVVMATQNLGRRKVRTVLTSVGVFVGIITIVTMVSLGIGIQRQITDTIESLGLETVFVSPVSPSTPGVDTSNARTHPQVPINAAMVDKLKSTPGVKSVEVLLSLPDAPDLKLTVGGKTFPFAIAEYDPQDRIFTQQETVTAGKAMQYTPDARGIVIPDRLLKAEHFTPDQYAGLVGQPASITVTAPRGDQQTFQTTVLGVAQSIGPVAVDVGNADKLDLKKWWYNDPNILDSEGYSGAILQTTSINDASLVSKQVSAMGLKSSTLQALLDQVNRIFSILQVMLSSVGLLALLVATIGIANTMIMSIYERTREIGTLKAIGSSNGDVLRIFMVEAGLIGFFGGIVGVIGGWLLGLLLNRVIDDYLKNQSVPLGGAFFVVTWDLALEALVFAALIGIVAGLYPAFRAARLDPLQALRHE